MSAEPWPAVGGAARPSAVAGRGHQTLAGCWLAAAEPWPPTAPLTILEGAKVATLKPLPPPVAATL